MDLLDAVMSSPHHVMRAYLWDGDGGREGAESELGWVGEMGRGEERRGEERGEGLWGWEGWEGGEMYI